MTNLGQLTPIDATKLGIEIVREHPDLAHFAGPASQYSIQEAQRKLGIEFPPSFVLFLEQLGGGSFGGTEFVGLFSDHSGPSSWPEIEFVHDAARKCGLDATWLLVSEDGAGGLYVIRCNSRVASVEPPVEHCGIDRSEDSCEIEAASFGHFFLSHIRERCGRV